MIDLSKICTYPDMCRMTFASSQCYHIDCLPCKTLKALLIMTSRKEIVIITTHNRGTLYGCEVPTHLSKRSGQVTLNHVGTLPTWLASSDIC